MEPKLEVITRTQTLCVILVVLGHCTPANSQQPPTPDFMYWLCEVFTGSFDMALFIFLSGFLFGYNHLNKPIEYFEFVKRRAYRLLIPYIALSTLAFIPKVLLSKYAMRPIQFSFQDYLHGLVYPWDNPIIYFWFLPTLFIIYLLAPFIIKLQQQNKQILFYMLLVYLVFYLWYPYYIDVLNINGVINYLPWFIGGMIVSEFSEDLVLLNRNWILVISLVILIIINQSGKGVIPLGAIGFKLHRLLTGCIGIIFSISFAYKLLKGKQPFLLFLDGRSYQIYLLSWFILIAIKLAYQRLGLNYYFTIFLMLFAALILPVQVSRIINERFKFLKPVFGL